MQVKLINRASECSIAQFMSCMFDRNFKVLVIEGDATGEQLQEAWENITLEYVELSGASDKHRIALIKRIEEFEIKIKTLKVYIDVQRQSLNLFAEPFLHGFHVFKKRGYSISWNNNIEDFQRQLKKIENQGKSDLLYLALAENQLQALAQRDKEKLDQSTNNRGREGFISILVMLPTAGYVIDRHKTTVEELAVMIRQFTKTSEKTVAERQLQRPKPVQFR